MLRRIRTRWLPWVVLAHAAGAWAQQAPASVQGSAVPTTLKQAFDAAWQRQPEAQSREARQQAAIARRQAADSWTAEPAALELSVKTDRLSRNQGSREAEAGLSVPLWLPGERSRTRALADAQLRAAASRTLAAQLRTAASVRDAFWLWQRGRVELELARERLGNAQLFAADVAKRVGAGDMARADQHQADGAVAAAEASAAEALNALAAAAHQLRTLTGFPPGPNALAALDPGAVSEPVPVVPADFAATLDSSHPAVVELMDRAAIARGEAQLAGVQTRGNPELTVATTRDRGAYGEPSGQTMTLGIRIPFGSDSRNRARQAAAQAESLEAQAQLGLEQQRLLSERDAARVRIETARTQVTAAERRSQLARESRGFFQKSFRMGETDLPTRLRVELEAADAEREAARARIELAAAVSALRQALGLLPE